jgi:MFS family permease
LSDTADIPEITPLTLAERRRGKKYYYSYAFFNSLSYAVLAEAVVILLVLRLGGGAVWVGAIGALAYATLPFMLLGHRLVPRLGVTGNAGLAWAVRSACAAAMIAAPWAATRLGGGAGLWFLFAGAFGFFTARAVGMISFTGIVTELTTERDKGELIATTFKLFQGGGLVMTALIALFLGGEAPLWRYQLFFAAGLVTGMAAAVSLWCIPESGAFRRTEPFDLRREWKWLTGTAGRRWFFAMMVAIPITQGVSRMFIVLVAKQGYGLPDQQVVLFLLVAIVGGGAASYTYGFFMDKLGSRPLLVLTTIADFGATGTIVLLPQALNPALLGGLFFVNGYVHIAFLAALQHYFISITDREHQLPQGILTQSVGGLAGGLALYAGGVGLAAIEGAVMPASDPLLQFRWFFGGFLVLLLARTVILIRIPALRSQGIRDSLNALLSPWDWRAIHAVKRAVALQSEDEETRSLDLIMHAGSAIYSEDLQSYLRSPSFAVRDRALEALAMMKPDMALIDILLEDVQVNLFTTAPQSAYWLGRWQVKRAASVLRKSINSPDIGLRGRAIQALVELGDREALPLIRRRFLKSANPLVIIGGARALALWEGPQAFGQLLQKFSRAIPPQTKDELSLSAARLMGLYDKFYSDLTMFRREPEQLRSEWRERYRQRDRDGLVNAVYSGSMKAAALRGALRREGGQYAPWFVASMEAFLDRNEEDIDPPAAFLLAFLLLHPRGEHLP